MTRHRISTFSISALAVFLSLTSSGCAFIFSKAPPVAHEQMNSFSCSEGNVAPVLDLIWGGLNVAGALIAASDQAAYENPGQIMAVGFGWGVVSGLSAVSGFKRSAQCREAKRQLGDRLARPRDDFSSLSWPATVRLPEFAPPQTIR
ncbi:MAG: hypothetical protein ACREMA_01720 [Longimicrobiales bacterium]